MEKEFEIIGKGLDTDVTKEAISELKKRRQEALEPLDGELEKSPEEIEFINLVNCYLKQEFRKLGLNDPQDILPSQLHFLPSEVYLKNFPDAVEKSFTAFHSDKINSAYFDKSGTNRLSFFKIIVHEIVHIDSFHKYLLASNKKQDKAKIFSYRSGYSISDPRKEHRSLDWFNEAVVDKIALDILREHIDELRIKLNITPEEEKGSDDNFWPYLDAINAVINEVAKNKGEDSIAVWEKIKRGQFTGKMMHLRDVDKYVDKGLLEKIAELNENQIYDEDLPPGFPERKMTINDEEVKIVRKKPI
jgi:hypothetical protein